MITRVAFAGSVALTKGSSPVGQKNLFDERRKVLEVSGLCLPVAKGLGRVTLFQVQVATCSESGSLPVAGFQLRLGLGCHDNKILAPMFMVASCSHIQPRYTYVHPFLPLSNDL